MVFDIFFCCRRGEFVDLPFRVGLALFRHPKEGRADRTRVSDHAQAERRSVHCQKKIETIATNQTSRRKRPSISKTSKYRARFGFPSGNVDGQPSVDRGSHPGSSLSLELVVSVRISRNRPQHQERPLTDGHVIATSLI